MLPVNVMLPSLEFILKHDMAEDDRARERWVSMHTLMLDTGKMLLISMSGWGKRGLMCLMRR